MAYGKILGIYISPNRGDPTIWMEQVHVIPGMGIEGDRYFQSPGEPNALQRTGREITLIEMEAIDGMARDGIQISPAQTRRNLVTSGISLNDLVGKQFSVGDIQLRGVRLCEPCDYLASRTHPGVKQSMTHRGGLRADILSEGYIHINDPITPDAKEQP